MATVAELPLRALPLRTDADGVIRVGGTRVTLDTVVTAYLNGSTTEEIVASYPVLELADIHAVIAHYLWNRAAVDAYLAERGADARAVREEVERRSPAADLRERLLSRKRLAS